MVTRNAMEFIKEIQKINSQQWNNKTQSLKLINQKKRTGRF